MNLKHFVFSLFLVLMLPLAVFAGTPSYLNFATWDVAVKKGEATSSPVKINVVDNNWVVTTATAPPNPQVVPRR